MFNYDYAEKVSDYIYFYKNNKIIAIYNPFVGLCVASSSKFYTRSKLNA